MRRVFAFVLVAAAASCGGGKGKVSEPSVPLGEVHAETPPPAPAADAGLAAPATQPSAPGEPSKGGNNIELKNAGTTDLNFGVTKGWGLAVFAYTGKPPKAKSVMLFEKACSASCDSPADAICPVCPEPQTKKEEQAMAKVATAKAGEALPVPWDGKLVTYEKVPGKKGCQCWKKVEPAADAYTVKACGLRPSPQPGKPSKPVCAETQVNLGPGDASPRTITVEFK